jgi:hypothetical protein
MIKQKIADFMQKLREIEKISSKEERHSALENFFTKDLEALGLKPGDYVYHDVTRDDVRRRDFIYGEEDDGSDIVIHVWTGKFDKITSCPHSAEEYLS